MSFSVLIVVTFVLTALLAVYVLYPVVRASSLGRRYLQETVESDRLADLLARRDAIYQAIRDLDFDRETGKLTAEDHRVMRARLTAEGVAVLQELDRLLELASPEDLEAEIERQVAALRAQRARSGRERVTRRRVCPECGQPAQEDALFCVACGASLGQSCPSCGTVFEPGDRYCRVCGVALSVPQPSEAVHADADPR